MTAIQMNAELLRNMSIIAEDENLLKRAAKYLRKLVAEKKEPNADTSALELEIDQLVYKHYGLTDDEIAIVEGRNETKQEPQGETARRPSASPRRRKQVTISTPSEPTDDKVLE